MNVRNNYVHNLRDKRQKTDIALFKGPYDEQNGISAFKQM